MSTPSHGGRAEIATHLHRQLLYLKDRGVRTLDRADETRVNPAPEPEPVKEPAPAQAPTLEAIAADIADCTRCPLSKTRTHTVPGEGCPQPDILFIGEGPGAEEDRQGRPFVGRAGGILERMIKAMGYERDRVFIANIVKCRPTVDGQMKRDRPPSEEEMEACLPYLKTQIKALQPKSIVTLGNTALLGLFGFKGITQRRGQWLEFEGIPAMPTYHPSFLLRGGGEGHARWWEVWDDLVEVLKKLGRPIPEKKRKK